VSYKGIFPYTYLQCVSVFVSYMVSFKVHLWSAGRRPAHSIIIIASLSKNYITGIVLEVAELAMLRE